MAPVLQNAEQSIRSLRLFLASPGGVEAERKAVRRLAEELSVVFRRHGWQVEVLGWEDRGPASGRAQAEINADVERCDIFLGIVWDRWGTPTGKYTSGFAEEWAMARERWEADGSPELWLCFKHFDQERQHDDEHQLAQVREFRESIERDEVAFYKTFQSPAELEVAIRRELLNEFLERAGVAPEAVGTVEVDWSSALAHEPVALLSDGQERERLADELSEKDPDGASKILTDLAAELEEFGFTDLADTYRRRSATVLIKAGRHEEALGLWRRVLLRSLETHHPTDFSFAARELGEQLPPEHQWEASAWTACVEWPLDREHSIQSLQRALLAPGCDQLDLQVTRIWRRTLWELWLVEGKHDLVVVDAKRVEEQSSIQDDDELALLLTEALSASGDPTASDRWTRLRARALELAKAEPSRAAQITARWAVLMTSESKWTEAEEGFIRAATLLTKAEGNEEESAEYFFSAQSVARLAGEWSFKGWGWRPMAASLRSANETPMTKASRYERAGMAAQVVGDYADARQELLLGLAIHRRAGHLRGAMALTRALADAYCEQGEEIEAVVAYCECSDGERAKKAAAKLTTTRELSDRLPVGRSEWESRASCAVLSHLGRFTSPERAAEILPTVLEMSRRSTEDSGNAAILGAEALAELCVALPDGNLGEAVERLCELLSEQHYALSQAGGEGLRMLTEIERVDADDALIVHFANSPTRSVVWPRWVSERLDTPQRIGAVRAAALHGEPLALLALGLADYIKGDAELEARCSAYAEGITRSDIGRGPENSILGLVAFDVVGGVASFSRSAELRREVAEKLLLYALETNWPMVNRISALRGVAHLAKTLEPADYVVSLRPLADPEIDLDADSTLPFDQAWIGKGELEAEAIRACVDLCSSSQLPQWLHDAAFRARTDPRPKMRAAAWRSTAAVEEIGIDGAVGLALIDPEIEVRLAALHCWRKRHPGELPPANVLDRLINDPYVNSRRQVLEVLSQHGVPRADPRVKALLNDADAYNARLAAMRFSESPSDSVR